MWQWTVTNFLSAFSKTENPGSTASVAVEAIEQGIAEVKSIVSRVVGGDDDVRAKVEQGVNAVADRLAARFGMPPVPQDVRDAIAGFIDDAIGVAPPAAPAPASPPPAAVAPVTTDTAPAHIDPDATGQAPAAVNPS